MAIFFLIFFLLLTAYGFLIDYYRRGWNAIPSVHADYRPDAYVAVIVPVRNEAGCLTQLLDSLRLQEYDPDLVEVIVVDDHSTDGTATIAGNHEGVRLIRLDSGVAGKKAAIAAGIAATTAEFILTTDADCVMGPQWVSSMVAFAQANQAEFVAAPVRMQPVGRLVAIFQSLDFLTLQGITGAAVFKRFHSMCNGANILYTRKAFIEVNGFAGIDNIPSGDDMLLMHKISVRYPHNVFYLKNRQSIVTTKPEKSWGDFFQQRIRWASKAVHYQDKKIIATLLLTYLVNLFFIIGAVLPFFHPDALGIFLLFALAKVLVEFPFVNTVSIFFERQRLMWYFIPLQPLHIFYVVFSGWLGRFGSYTWKSRKIKNAAAIIRQ